MKANTIALLLILPLVPVLVAADWDVRIDGVHGTSIDFSTGDAAAGATIKIELYDVCRVDSAYRQEYGELYPSNHVDGLWIDATSVNSNPGCCNKVIYSFEQHINQTRLWTDNFDGTGTVSFCAQVALYDGGTMVTLAEVRVEYQMNTASQEVWLVSHSITDAAGFMDADDSGVGFDGSLQAYFCDPNSHTLTDYGVIGQGTVMSICFQVPDGQFEVRDVMELSVHGADGYGPSQTIISGASIPDDAVALKSCHDNGEHDTNICIVQFLLKTEFFETSAVTLTGAGTVLLELGDSSHNRQLLKTRSVLSAAATMGSQDSRVLGDSSDGDWRRQMQRTGEDHFITSPYQVKASRFFVTPGSAQIQDSSNDMLFAMIDILFAVLILAIILCCCVVTCYIAHRLTMIQRVELVFNESSSHASPDTRKLDLDESAVENPSFHSASKTSSSALEAPQKSVALASDC